MRLVGVVVLFGCGRIGFDPQATTGDAPVDSAPVVACTTWGPFGTPVDLAVSRPSTDNWVPRITRDELSLYFAAFIGGGFDVVVATRATRDVAFTTSVTVADVASARSDQSAQQGATSGALYVMHDDVPAEVVEYPEVSPGSFGTPRVHAALNNLRHFSISEDELRVYWMRNGIVQLSSRPTLADTFGAPTILLDLVTANDSGASLTLSLDELELIVGVNRQGGVGGLDVYRLVRPDVMMPFGGFEPLAAVNTTFDEVVGSLSPDGSTLYVNADTDINGGRDAKIATSTRACLD